jgi:4-hydroxyphenylpyruvate dioxygenase
VTKTPQLEITDPMGLVYSQAAGLPFLGIGPNYCEDIEARFGLYPALVRRMAALNILCDRDGEAEYFQVYSRAVAKRVFFEVVERRGYDGYGVANTAIRLNSQARFRRAMDG